MDRRLLEILVCPGCGVENLDLKVREEEDGEILSGTVACPACRKWWPIERGIPRFVRENEDYAGNFAFEWNRWGRVQFDRFAGHTLSEDRFLRDGRFDPAWLKGKLILDAGCGAGRFTDIAAKYGARVVAVDLSEAVDACRANTLIHEGRVQPVQASFYHLPFKPGSFDALFCMGVIQHTPNPEKTMRVLPKYLKKGGRLAYNWYEVTPVTKFQPLKYALRLVTPHLPNAVTHAFCFALTLLFFPISYVLHFIPKVRIINIALPICPAHLPGLTLRQQFAWTLLDTFDWYSPRYEIRQDKNRVAEILRAEGLDEVEVADGLGWAKQPK